MRESNFISFHLWKKIITFVHKLCNSWSCYPSLMWIEHGVDMRHQNASEYFVTLLLAVMLIDLILVCFFKSLNKNLNTGMCVYLLNILCNSMSGQNKILGACLIETLNLHHISYKWSNKEWLNHWMQSNWKPNEDSLSTRTIVLQSVNSALFLTPHVFATHKHSHHFSSLRVVSFLHYTILHV